MFSSNSTLFAAKHRGGLSPTKRLRSLPSTFNFRPPTALFRHPRLHVILWPVLTASNRAQTRRTCHGHFACKPFSINRLRTLSISNGGGGAHNRHLFKFYLRSKMEPH